MQYLLLGLKKTKKTAIKDNKPSLNYRTLKFLGLLLLIWPSDKKTKWFYRILHEIFWWILMINESFLFFGISIGFYYFYADVPTFTTTIFIVLELVVICENIYTSILFKVQRPRIKALIAVLENTMNNVNSKEKILLHEIMKTCTKMNFIISPIYCIMLLVYIYLHLYEPTLILPKEVWHPFFIDPFHKKCLVLIQQMAYIIHIISINVADGLVCMILNVASVKLQVLAETFEKGVDNIQLKKLVRQHQEIIWYVKEINSNMRIMILKTLLATTFYLIFGFLQLVHMRDALNLLLVYQFIAAVAIANYRVFYIAQCADTLSTMSENLRFALPWSGKPREMSKTICIIILRCQKPLRISICGIMPQFSLKYYGTFLYFTFSYFLTLKAILELKISF